MRREARWNEVLRSQRQLLAACESLDGDAIERATEDRRTALLALRAELDAPDEFSGRLAELTQEAAEALESMQSRIRSHLLDVRRGVRAAHGYRGAAAQTSKRKSSALDRSG